MRAHQKPGRPPCGVAGCDRPLYCKDCCTLHYERLRTKGAIGEATPRRNINGSGHVNEYGYRVHKVPDHPLARSQGKVLEHRMVLWDKVGPGPHPCEWCGKPLEWDAPRQSLRINVDHLDHDRLNNEPQNLVVACLDCNTKRRAVAA